MEKFKTVKKIIDGVEYTAQFNGLSAALEAVDNSYIDGSSNTSSLKMAKYILENVIVAPRVDIDSFENAEKLNNVLDFGREVMQGNFREPEEQSGAKEKAAWRKNAGRRPVPAVSPPVKRQNAAISAPRGSPPSRPSDRR